MVRSVYTFFIFSFICITYQSAFSMDIFNFSPKNLFSTNILPDKTQAKNAALFLACTALPTMVDGCYRCSSPDDAPKQIGPLSIALSTVGSILICAMGCTVAWRLYCIDVSYLPPERRRAHNIFWLRIGHIFGCCKDISIPEDDPTSIPLETVTIQENNNR